MLDGTPLPRPGEVRRDRLDDLVSSERILLVRAGRGAGKTSAVASWARGTDLPGGWIDVSAVDGDVPAFWSRVRTVLGIDASEPDRAVAERVRSLDAPSTLVLDGVDALDPAALRDLIEMADGSSLRLIIVSRRDLVVPLGLQDLDHRLITADALALSPTEVGDVLRAWGVSASPGFVGFAHAASGGVPLLVSIIARCLDGGSASGETLSRAQAARLVRTLDDLILAQGLQTVPSGDLPLLRTAALLSDASIDDIARLTGEDRTDIDRALEAAADVGWGSWVVEADDAFEFDPLVSRALAFRILMEKDTALLARASHVLSERGDGVRAMMLAFDAEDDDLILQTGARHFGALMEYHNEVLIRLQSIPRRRVAEHPLIALAIAVCHSRDARSRIPMLMSYARAERLALMWTSKNRPADRVVLHFVRSSALMHLGRHSWAHIASTAAVNLVESLSDDESAGFLLSPGLIWGQAAVTSLVTGDVHAAKRFAEHAIGAARSTDIVHHHEMTKAAFLAAVDGDMLGVGHHLGLVSRRPGWDQSYLAAFPRIAESVLALERGDTTTSRRLIAETLPDFWTSPLWPITEAVLAVADVRDGRPGRAAHRIRAALDFDGAVPPSETDKLALRALLALALLADGDIAGARSVAGRLRSSGGGFVVRAALEVASGDELSAIMTTTSGLASTRTVRVRVSLLLLRTTAALRLGRRSGAERDARSVMEAFTETGSLLPWLLVPEADREALVRLFDDIDGADQEVIGRLRTMPVVVGEATDRPRLTKREHAVLLGIFARETTSDTAIRLGVSPNTVKKQRASLYRKLAVSTWEDAVHAAVEHGLLDERV